MMRHTPLYLQPVLYLSLLLGGCSFSGIGSDLGDGLSQGLARQSDSIGAGLGSGLIRSIRDSLTSELTMYRLNQMVDSVIATAGYSANEGSVALRDSLLLGIMNDRTRDWLLRLERDLTYDLVLASAGISDNLLGDATRRRVRALRNELLGDATLMFVAALRDSLAGPELRRQLGLLRDELLGERTRLAVDSLLIGASDRLREVTRGEESFLKRNITEILWTAGAVLALVIIVAGFVFAKVRRYRKMLEVLTFQIHELPDQRTYDRLTGDIQRQATQTGVEGELRKFLKDHGLVGEGSWKK